MNEESAQMHRELQQLMAKAETEARAIEVEAALLRKQGYAIVSDEWSAMMAEVTSAHEGTRWTQLALVNAKIEMSKAIYGPRSRAFAAAGRQATDLIEAAERARDGVLEKAMKPAAEPNDATGEEARKHYQSALLSTTIFFDEVVRQATELLEAAEDDVSDLRKERAQQP